MSEGASFGQYRVVRKIGQGGMGAVFLGEHTLIGRRAAIKVLHRERSTQRESVERFFTEARATSAMEDPGIVQVYDFGVTTDGTAYLIMEFLDGEPLSARLRKRGALHPADAVRITRQIAGSLAAAHATGIVHRDLKPENLFMIRDNEALGGERPKILDFGIAKLGDEQIVNRHHTRTGAVMGTPAYMSPEQCNDTGKIDHRTDIYSLGCVLFHLLTGRPPFDLAGTGAIIAAHLREPAPVPSRVANVPEILDPIVARCLAKEPDDRYATMSELQQACEAALSQLPPPPPRSSHPLIEQNNVREDAITTLGTSAGESLSVERPFPVRLWAAIAVVAVAAGIVLAVTTHGGRGTNRTPITPVIPAATPAPELPPVTPETPPPATTVTPTVPGIESVGVTSPATGSAAEVGAAPTTAVPSKTPGKRPPRKVTKKRNPADTYEDRN